MVKTFSFFVTWFLSGIVFLLCWVIMPRIKRKTKENRQRKMAYAREIRMRQLVSREREDPLASRTSHPLPVPPSPPTTLAHHPPPTGPSPSSKVLDPPSPRPSTSTAVHLSADPSTSADNSDTRPTSPSQKLAIPPPLNSISANGGNKYWCC